MTTNHREFAIAFRQQVERLKPEQIVPFKKFVHLTALRRIILLTPVLTGRARNSWQSTIGAPAEDDIFQQDPQLQAEAALAGIQLGDPSFITSNVPYIIYLEDGSSNQAPSGMIALTVEEISRIKVDLNK